MILRPLSLLKLPSLKLTFSHLKMDGWNTILSFWGPPYFQGLWLLVSGRVDSRQVAFWGCKYDGSSPESVQKNSPERRQIERNTLSLK